MVQTRIEERLEFIDQEIAGMKKELSKVSAIEISLNEIAKSIDLMRLQSEKQQQLLFTIMETSSRERSAMSGQVTESVAKETEKAKGKENKVTSSKMAESDRNFGFDRNERKMDSDDGFHDRNKFKKIEMPVFTGEDPDSWLFRAERWDAEGPFKPLHALNPTRVSFIRSTLCRHFRRDPCSVRPFEGLKFIDVGCGGGILSEPLARMGATVTGIDMVDNNIKIARVHADLDPVTSTIEYYCTTAENLVEQQKEFDAVIASEVIEHVANPAGFCQSLAALTVANGATIVSTINRSMRAFATAIVAAEYILRWLPIGTHQWSSLLTPEELVLILQRASISVEEMAGFVYNPLTGQWSLSDDTSVNYIAFGKKISQQTD